MPQLHRLVLNRNPIGSQGLTALALPLRKLPALRKLGLDNCEIGDEGVASLVADLGKDNFKALEWLDLLNNRLTDASCDQLVAALDIGAFPRLTKLLIDDTQPRCGAVHAALARAKERQGAAA